MRKYNRRKCLHCCKMYHPDPRNRTRQNYCSAPDCKQESKRRSQQRWLNKPANRNYFKGDKNSDRVRTWREEHPGYWKKHPKDDEPLQDTLNSQPVAEQQDKCDLTPDALQDVLMMQPVVLLGLISTFTGVTLQDDIASQVRNMHARGQQILGKVPGSQPQGNHVYTQTTPSTRSSAPGASAVQLARSPPGP